MRYQLQKTQQLNCDLDTAWKFFSTPENLARITPKEMNFIVHTNLACVPMFVGMAIDYTVTPLLKIPIKWKTRITQVDERKSFTDFQEKGPYKYWNHRHEFIPNDKGVLMKDTIDYELPYGFLGDIVHTLIVKKKLARIFYYRTKIANEMFNAQFKTV